VALSAPGSAFDDITQNPNSPYYIGPVTSEVSSGDDIRAEVTRQVDNEIAHGWLGDVVTPLARDKEIQKRYEQQIAGSRQNLDEGLEMRDNGAAPSTVWDNATHEQMLSAINENADSAAVAVTSEEWVRLGNELTDHQQNLADAISDSLSDWQGAGGDAAREHLASVGKWLGTTAKGATLTGRQQEIHSQALNETQKQMAANPPVQFDVQAANAHLQTITDPVVYAQQAQIDQDALRQQEAARQQAARVMAQYDETVGAAATTPAFSAPPKLAGPSATTATLPSGAASTMSSSAADTANQAGLLSGTAATPAGTGGTDQLAAAAMTSAGMPGGADTTGAGVPDELAAAGTGGASLDSASVPGLETSAYSADGVPLSASTSGSGSVNTPALSSVDYPSGSSSSSGSIPSIPDSTLPSSVTGTDLSSTSGDSTRMPTIGYSGGVNGDSIASRLGGTATPTGTPLSGLDSFGGTGGISGTSLGGSGSSGLKGVGGLGSTGGSKGVGGLGTGESAAGSGSKLGAGASSGAAAAAEEAAAGRGGAGAAGAAGRSGTSGAGMGGHGGKGKGEEDKEHRVADYLEGDPDFFEGEQVVAPPVIGDWKKSKEAKKK
jgi:hypothetical protein